MKQSTKEILVYIKAELEKWNQWFLDARLACEDHREQESVALLYHGMVDALTYQMAALDSETQSLDEVQQWCDNFSSRYKQHLSRHKEIDFDTLQDRGIAIRKQIRDGLFSHGQTV